MGLYHMGLSPTSPAVIIQKLIKITFAPGDRNERKKLSLKKGSLFEF